jgi:hypothetical protein
MNGSRGHNANMKALNLMSMLEGLLENPLKAPLHRDAPCSPVRD